MLGVLGGMGPMATVDFMKKVVENTSAACDQDHIPMVICSACQIPDRTAAILNNGSDPFPHMLDAIQRLAIAGATVIAIPCNTAHFWHEKLQARTSIPILHIVDAGVDELRASGVLHGRIGVLATTGTIKARIYQDRLSARGYNCDIPEDQHLVTQAIQIVKAGGLDMARNLLEREARILLDKGCSHVIMGCTEIPIALADVDDELGSKLIDSTKALALASIRQTRSLLYKAA